MAKKKNMLPKYLTTVTPFSKLLAVVLFVSLPFFAFRLGMKFQEKVSNFDSETIISWTQFNVDGKEMAPGILNNFTYPSNWTFFSLDSGAGSFMYFSDLGGETKQSIKERNYRLRTSDSIVSLAKTDWDKEADFTKQLPNVCGIEISVGVGSGKYLIGERTNTKLSTQDRRNCEEILGYIQAQIKNINNQ